MGVFGPKNYKVRRSKEIAAPIHVVYEQVSKFNNWDSWSPWKEKDPTATYTIDGEDGAVGTKYAWTGDAEITGKGSMTINEVIENKKFGYDLEFTEPWTMTSKGYFELTEKEGTTIINWIDEGDIPFMQRPMMMFMDLDAMMGPDFERGLIKIDSLSIIKKEELSQSQNIIETEFAGGKYVGVMKNIKISEIDSTIYGNAFGAIGVYFAQNNITTAGAPSTITLKWDEAADSCQMLIAFPVTEAVTLTDDRFTYLEIPSTKSIFYKYYGDYNKMGNAYDEIHQYISKKGIEAGDYAIEEYITDPSTVEHVNEVLTNIYYLVK